MLKAGVEAIQKWVTPRSLTDPDVVLYAAGCASRLAGARC